MLSVEEALARILAPITPLGIELVALTDAQNRALGRSLVAGRPLPPWDNSAMDGFAVRANEIARGKTFPVATTIAAGRAPLPLAPGAVARIMTGAPLPAGADAVIMREQADETAEGVQFRIVPKLGDHIRRAGEDVRAEEEVLALGDPLGPGEIGLAAALGRTLIEVHRRPRVAILSTGDELVDPDRVPGPGQIVGSNAYALAAQCRSAGAMPTVLPIARDDRAHIAAAFEEALHADAVISSGGVSVGDFDFVKEALASLGVKEEFWRVAMKPGKPIAFGSREGRPVFGLPGNPAASLVGFELFVRPALLRMAGHHTIERPRAPVVLASPYRHEGERRHYLRARVSRDGTHLTAQLNPRQGSGHLSSLVGINALVEIPEQAGPVAAGATMTALLLEAV